MDSIVAANQMHNFYRGDTQARVGYSLLHCLRLHIVASLSISISPSLPKVLSFHALNVYPSSNMIGKGIVYDVCGLFFHPNESSINEQCFSLLCLLLCFDLIH